MLRTVVERGYRVIKDLSFKVKFPACLLLCVALEFPLPVPDKLTPALGPGPSQRSAVHFEHSLSVAMVMCFVLELPSSTGIEPAGVSRLYSLPNVRPKRM